MIFEHFDINVLNPLELAKWYTSNCEMTIIKLITVPPFTHFLADSSGRSVIEIYSNLSVNIPDYNSLHPLEFHFAFKVKDISEMKEKLISAGAKLLEDVTSEDGSRFVMLRDPFGIPLQLCKRATPLI
jgi:glyoxylase I family protein